MADEVTPEVDTSEPPADAQPAPGTDPHEDKQLNVSQATEVIE